MFVDYDKESDKISEIINRLFPDGQFTPQQVVDAARPKNSPLHEYFEWNDSAAAELYRLNQARKIIQCLVVDIEGEEIREFHNVFVKEEDRRMYVRADRAMRAEPLWKQVLETALQEAVSWRKRYESLKQLQPIVVAIKNIEREHEKNKNNSSRKRTKDKYPKGRTKNGKNYSGRRVAAASKSV